MLGFISAKDEFCFQVYYTEEGSVCKEDPFGRPLFSYATGSRLGIGSIPHCSSFCGRLYSPYVE
jgi:hypothetical protein